MAATDQHYRHQKTLDIVFAVSCVLMLISTIWMFVQDYNREFKQVQRDFRDVEATLNDRMMLARLPSAAEVTARREKVDAARKALAEEQASIAPVARGIQLRRDRQDAKTRSLKADFDARSSYLVQTRDELSIATGAEKTRLQSKMVAQEQDLDRLGASLNEAQKELEKIDTEYKDKVRKKLGPKEEAFSNAEDSLKKMTNEFDRFAKASAQKTWRFGDTFRNLPILDAFASPTRINQIVLPELTIDYSFKEVPRYDRCMTCHLGIDRAMFDREALWAIGQAPPELTEKLKTAREILMERAKSGEILGFDPSDLSDKVRVKKLTKGQVTMYATHPRLDLFLDTNSPHRAQDFGCTICHGGQGSATDFNLASHAPANAHQEHEWDKIYNWKPNHDWDYPMLSNRFTESSCLKCHHQVTDLVTKGSHKEAPKVERGYELVRDNGCFGCHEISGLKAGRAIGPDLRLEPVPPLEWLTPTEQTKLRSDPLNPPGAYRKVGPSLRRIVEKTNEEWARKWIASPRTFRPDTKMPHFYGLSNNTRAALKADREAREKATGKPDPVPQEDFPDAEIHSIAHYLFAESAAHLKADDTYRRALILDLTTGLNKQKERALNDKEKKDLEEVTRLFIDLALLSMPARSSEINTLGDDLRRLEDRFNGLYRRQTELEALQKQKNSEEESERLQKEVDNLPAQRDAVAKELDARTKELIDAAKPIPIAKAVQTVDHGTASVKPLEEKATPATIDQGRKLFTEKGCLACHSHEGTEGRGKASVAGEANFGPNLSRIAAKIKPTASNDARRWLYQWILNPNIHHPRTHMPYTRLTDVEARDVADWLLSQTVKDFDEQDPPAPESKTLRMLARVYLAKAPGMTRADVEEAIPLDMSQKIGFIEDRLKGMARDAEEHRLVKGASDDDLKWYIGKKSISRLGCYGCHDISGFEQGKPIGTELNDWGKKDPQRIAFEDSESYVRSTANIVPYRQTKQELEALIRKLDRAERVKELQAKDDLTDEERWELIDLTNPDTKDPENLKARTLRQPMTDEEKAHVEELRHRLKDEPLWNYKDGKAPYEKFFYEALAHQTRDGFLHQKLMEPRSYDYNRTRTWDDRLRMPQFKFARTRRHHDESDDDFKVRQSEDEAEAREAVMTFILGLTAENISPKYIYKPAPDRLAEVKGRQILEKYNCIGCHQARSSVFEFKLPEDARRRLQVSAEASAKRYEEKYAFPGHNAWTGVSPTVENRLTAIANFNPAYNPTKSADEAPVRNGHPVNSEGRYDLRLNEALRFTDPTGMTHDLPAGESISVALPDVLWFTEPFGGKFSELMLPYLIATGGSAFLPDNARDVLPPPLHREGERVQPNWLYQFLLNPKTIRPHVILNMPHFNMSLEEASALVDYFVAVEKLTNPGTGAGTAHLAIPQRDDQYWHEKTPKYVAELKKTKQLDERLKKLEPYWKLVLQEEAQAAVRRREIAEDAYKKAMTDETAKANLDAAKKDAEAAEKRLKDDDFKGLATQYQERNAYADDSYRLLISVAGRACLGCHQIQGSGGKKAPPLDLAADRLRPEWTKRWIANPQAMFSYNPAMPVNIAKRPKGSEEFKDLFVGSSLQQISAIRDTLMDLPHVSNLPANRFYHMAPAGGK